MLSWPLFSTVCFECRRLSAGQRTGIGVQPAAAAGCNPLWVEGNRSLCLGKDACRNQVSESMGFGSAEPWAELHATHLNMVKNVQCGSNVSSCQCCDLGHHDERVKLFVCRLHGAGRPVRPMWHEPYITGEVSRSVSLPSHDPTFDTTACRGMRLLSDPKACMDLLPCVRQLPTALPRCRRHQGGACDRLLDALTDTCRHPSAWNPHC